MNDEGQRQHLVLTIQYTNTKGFIIQGAKHVVSSDHSVLTLAVNKGQLHTGIKHL